MIRTIYEKEGGLKGLYAGLGSDTLATVLSSFIYFYCYTSLRNVQEALNKSMGKRASLNVAQELFLGAEAALISRFFTTPFSNVTTRLQTSSRTPGKQQQGFIDTAKDIYHEKGISGFWTGYRASMMLVSNPSITYFVFEKAKSLYLAGKGVNAVLSSLEVFLFSALAKSVATMITYPFIFIRTSMVANRSEKYSLGMRAFMKHVIDKEGLQGLYKVMWVYINMVIWKGSCSCSCTFIFGANRECEHKSSRVFSIKASCI